MGPDNSKLRKYATIDLLVALQIGFVSELYDT